jgi:hypothetical protein
VSNDDQVAPSERILNPRQRSPAVHLPEDPAEEELARSGDDNRHRFAIQLCVLRRSKGGVAPPD